MDTENGEAKDKLLHILHNLQTVDEKNISKQIIGEHQNEILTTGKILVSLPDNIEKQDFLTQMYILGCSLHRYKETTLCMSVLKTVIDLYKNNLEQKGPESLNTDEIILMKMYYELACCEEENNSLDECIEHYEESIALSFHHNDISFEKQVSMRLCSALMQKERYSEAAAGYVRLLSLASDLLAMLDNDLHQYRMHWNIECDCEIRYNLCLAYSALNLYEKALHEAHKFKELIQTLGDWKLNKLPIANLANGFTYMMQANFLLGKLYDMTRDPSSALNFYQEWLAEVYTALYLQKYPDAKLQLELSSAYQCVGNVFIKMKRFVDAFSHFEKITKIGQKLQNIRLEVNGLLLQGDAKLASQDIQQARDLFSQAMKLSQVLRNTSLECQCMSKEAATYAKEGRYTYALYHCERALHLSRTCDCKDNTVSLEREVALHTQHSTSEKELVGALAFLSRNTREMEQTLYRLKLESVTEVREKENDLAENYEALQIILHRLGENKLSLAFAESYKRREMLHARKATPEMPLIEHKDLLKSIEDFSSGSDVELLSVDRFLSPATDCTVIMYSFCQSGFIAHVMEKGLRVTYSYLLSEHVPNADAIVENLGKLVGALQKCSKDDPSTNLSNIYNTESRSLPESGENITVKLPALQRGFGLDGGGDMARVTNVNAGGVESSKSPDSKFSFTCEGEVPAKKPTAASAKMCEAYKSYFDMPVGDQDRSWAPHFACAHCKKTWQERENLHLIELCDPHKQLFSILIQPLLGILSKLPRESTICFVTDGILKQVPFDNLINPLNNLPLGETFNVTHTPCLLALDNCRRCCKDTNENKRKNLKSSSRRKRELIKTFVQQTDLETLEKAKMDIAISGLVSCSSTGTNILTSPRYITPYRQIDTPLHSSVIGSPTMPKSLQLNGNLWRPRSSLMSAQQECKKVAEYLDTSPIIGVNATKKEFLSEISRSTLIHISTYGSIRQGLLAFRPNEFPFEHEPVSMNRYIVTEEDLVLIKPINTKLAVLSSGYDSHMKGNSDPSKLPNVILNAGVHCVIYSLHPIPDAVSQCFFYHLYLSCQTACPVSRAIYKAKTAVKARHPEPFFWNAFVAAGSDVTIDISEIRSAELQRSISKIESDRLSVPTLVETGDTQEECFCKLQQHLSCLSGHLDVLKDSDVVSFLLGLLEEATERLTSDENSDRPIVVLPKVVKEIKGSTDILSVVGFDFQSVDISTLPPAARKAYSGKSDEKACMVVFPHWNQDGLLLPLHQVLTGLHDLCANSRCLRAVALMLPLSQGMLCRLIDLLSIIYHTPEVQLQTSDVGVRTLWEIRDLREFMLSIGFINIRTTLVFCRSLENRSLLLGSLQLLLSVCCHRDFAVLKQINVESLGKLPQEKKEDLKNFKSINALVMPRNEILLRSSWMSDSCYIDEKGERKLLANHINDITERFSRALEHAKWWHQDVKIPRQAVNSNASGLLESNRKSHEYKVTRKVKVESGATPSCNRTAIKSEEKSTKNLYDVLTQREEARYILHRRCVDLHRRQATALRSTYLPYTQNSVED